MISLSTGLPGAGKTLYTIAYVKDLAEKENRPVFYSGIKDLVLDWTEIEAEKWMDCPEGAIIVIDECQRLYRPRGNGSKVPDYVSALETHRHKGHDIFLVTQHPMLVDSNVRRLTERHWHISRRFGMHRTTIFQYESCKDQPLAKIADAQRLEWKYPREVFSYYKSAEVHTVKRRLPMQYFLMFIIPVMIAGLVWYFVQRHYKNGEIVIPGTEQLTQKSPGSKSEKAAVPEKSKIMTPTDYVSAYQPRVQGLAYTAPIYDKLTEPDEVPIPTACLSSKNRGCKCYSQQATLLDMPQDLCQQIVKNGFFQAFGNKGRGAGQLVRSDALKSDPVKLATTDPSTSMGLPPTDKISLLPEVMKPVANDSTNPRFNPALHSQRF
ncbi:zonular occludens toxin domain-containing protein [Propionivibrio sp.]|uniref:zonular occludens toxin domain-containing protein n=1 Tax=Propionivibrio sp. TaxID=2212460 RepID=UPI002628CDBD|nr:zonular occludens toxin domain-containing protein [Propionivibrio sp.]